MFFYALSKTIKHIKITFILNTKSDYFNDYSYTLLFTHRYYTICNVKYVKREVYYFSLIYNALFQIELERSYYTN